MAFEGIPPVADDASPRHDLGTKMESPDGRVWRYVGVGGSALVVGDLVQAEPEDSGEQNLAIAAASAGATQIVTTSTITVDANEYAGGFIVVSTTPGLGQVFRVKSHLAYSAAAATFELEDPVQVALTTASRIDLVPNLYDNVIQNPASATSAPLGVAVKAISANRFGWIQTRGVAGLLNQGNWLAGQLLVASNGTAGAAEIAVNNSTEAQAPVGVALTAGTGGEVNLVLLHLE